MQYRYFFRDLLAAAANDTENISIEAVFQYEFYRAVSHFTLLITFSSLSLPLKHGVTEQ